MWFNLGTDTLKLFYAYIYPYPIITKSIGNAFYIPIVLLQIVVISSYLASLFIGHYKYTIFIARLCAVTWFIIISFVMLASILH